MKRSTGASSRADALPLLRRLACLACMVCLACLLAAAPARDAGARDAAPAGALHVLAAEMLSTPGGGYAAPPAALAPDGPAGRWEAVALPHLLPRPLAAADARGTAATAITWYRVHVPRTGSARFLYLPRWKTDGHLAIYGDGRLLYQSHGDINWNGWNIPLWLALDDTTGMQPLSTLLLRIEPPPVSGGGISTLWIGTEAQIEWRYRVRQFLQVQLPAVGSAAFLAVGLFALFLWIRLRGDAMYGLFFCVALASFLRTLHYYVGERKLLIPEAWFSWLTINAVFWMVLVMHVFLNHLHRRCTRWLDRAVVVFVAAVAVLTLPRIVPGVDAYRVAPLVYVLLLVLGTGAGCVGMVKSLRAASSNGVLLSAWSIAGMLAGVFDWLLQLNYVSPEAVYLGPYTNNGAFLIFMYILHRRYIDASEAVRQSNASLQRRLDERTRELEASHRRLREIEMRQTLNEERQRLMQDMHDGMGSSLVSALMVVEGGRIDHGMVAEVLRNCIDDLRLTIDSMEPVDADLLLLLATLRFRLGLRLEQAGIALHWQVTTLPALDWLDPRSSLHILRILQEAFTNIIKHARATAVTVATSVDGDDVLVLVRDNGIGFALDAPAAHPGKGIPNQQRRAAAIGARLDWQATGHGTLLTMRLPICRHGGNPRPAAASSAAPGIAAT